ncbi:MAG TPA: NAD-dependent epimerase/dehydratase family protein, partial [Terriglobia bacterium]|nr:NAD-dependent epimerase/dehydratase family protein [Terriglobia bacterium]
MKLAVHSAGIFVTGAAGFIGSRLCRFLEGRGAIQSIPADVLNVEELRECIHLQPRTVIHLASKGTVTTPLS